MPSDTSAVRTSEELPVGILTEYLRGKIEGVETGLTVKQFREGHSNLTYLLLCGDGREYVLRRGPLGPVALKAHDMAREYRVLDAVHRHFPEAPEPYHVCEDMAVLSTVFFIMERRRGIILRDSVPPALLEIADHPRRISEAFIDCMVRLHSIKVTNGDLAALGKPEGFLVRQVQGWAERWHRACTEDVRDMEVAGEWLARNLPASPPPTLVHNDYKLDNIMLSSVAKVEAVLDWEMATIGDPLADVGLTLCYWAWVDRAGVGGTVPGLTSRPGWYSRDDFVARYSERTGRDLSCIVYYEVLGIYKLAVILQQIYYRFRRGQTQDERFRNFDQSVRALARLAASLAEHNG
jgi:aminoglycoside phosphotransferase (APT) family kinase protein